MAQIKDTAAAFAHSFAARAFTPVCNSVMSCTNEAIEDAAIKALEGMGNWQIGAMAQLCTILASNVSIKDKRDAVKRLIESPLTHDVMATARAMQWNSEGHPELAKYKSVPLTYRYVLKNVPLNTLVAMAACLSSPLVLDATLLSRMQHDTWTMFGGDYGFDMNSYHRQATAILDSMAKAEGKTLSQLCDMAPNAPFPQGYGMTVATIATTPAPAAAANVFNTATAHTTVINTQGVTTMATSTASNTATLTALAAINPAVKPLLDGMLSQAGIPLTIDTIMSEVTEKNVLVSKLASQDAEYTKTLDDLRKKLSSQSAMPTNISITSHSTTIPDGQMKMVEVGSLFPNLSGVNMKVPCFAWDHAHPDVPEVNSDYIFRNEMLIKTLRCLASGENLWLQGHTGSGKTTFIEQVAARLNWPVARVAFDSNVDRSEMVGRMQLDGDGKGGTNSRWLPGILENATKNGYILLCDEMDAGHPNALYTLQPVLEGKPLTLLEDGGRVVPRGVMARVCATGNTTGSGDVTGLYPACRILSAATLDRFANFINVPYMTTDEETKLINNSVPGLTKTLVTKMVKFGAEMRQAFVTAQTPISYSPRRSVAFAREVLDLKNMGFQDESAVLTAAFKSKLYDAASDEFRQRITEIANASFGNIDPTKNLL